MNWLWRDDPENDLWLANTEDKEYACSITKIGAELVLIFDGNDISEPIISSFKDIESAKMKAEKLLESYSVVE